MTQITEDKARSMDAGEQLDRICAEWMGIDAEMHRVMWHGKSHDIAACSTMWTAAGPLLEAMTADLNTGPEGWLASP